MSLTCPICVYGCCDLCCPGCAHGNEEPCEVVVRLEDVGGESLCGDCANEQRLAHQPEATTGD